MSSDAESIQKENIDFSKLNKEERVKVIDGVLDDKIRHMLAMDGGNMEIVDIKENDNSYEVYIRYLGACDGCASGSSGTLYAIESILCDEIDDKIRVIPL